jgi:predicted RecB family nuclease
LFVHGTAPEYRLLALPGLVAVKQVDHTKTIALVRLVACYAKFEDAKRPPRLFTTGGYHIFWDRTYNRGVLTDAIFAAFLNCETKSYLKLSGEPESPSEFTDWSSETREDYRRRCHSRYRLIFPEQANIPQTSSVEDLKTANDRVVFDCTIETLRFRSQLDAVERVSRRSNGGFSGYIPIRFVSNEKLSRQDKLLLAFDAFTLGEALGKSPPPWGKIIHGEKQRFAKVKLLALLVTVRSIIGKILSQEKTSQPPQLVLNKHCAECGFNSRCRPVALEKGDLSLLPRVGKLEREKLHNCGIFSIQQLSYTFRARRNPKNSASRPYMHFPALKARAIREKQVHICGELQLDASAGYMFLDVEGVPDRDFYYLIGLRIKNRESCSQYSFWADDVRDEKEIWAALVARLATCIDLRLLYYGSYETTFLQRMIQRYPEVAKTFPRLDRVTSEAVNVLQITSTQIYFPTYSNGLKEIAQYLGFHWTDSLASGLYSLMWRSQWDRTKDPCLKDRIITYNAEDCAALELVVDSVLRLGQYHNGDVITGTDPVVHAESIRGAGSYRFGRIEFSLPELDYINKAAYWNYQRSRVYVKSSRRLRQLSRGARLEPARKLRPNKILECQPPRPASCPKCHATKIYKYGKLSKTIYDLKCGPTGIKRWIVKYYFPRFLCWRCKSAFTSRQIVWTKGKYGSCFTAYLVFNVVDLHLSQGAVARSFSRFFGFDLGRGAINNLKARAAMSYQDTYKQILASILCGELVQADETKINVEGRCAFVWVFTNLEAVAYVYSDDRTNATPKNLLSDFSGVLVSDFYGGYDAINCRQQKCLIHLIRDLNDDLYKQPFNEELKALVSDFANLLRPMIQTVDRFGLKAHFLRRHRRFVDRFYRALATHDFQSDVSLKYKKRLERNRDRLFTFLEFDGIPWNNNNAEHAIKALADLRNVIGGTSSVKGMREYLILLSISQTCKYKGVDFFEFLRFGEKDIDCFSKKSSRHCQVMRTVHRRESTNH